MFWKRREREKRIFRVDPGTFRWKNVGLKIQSCSPCLIIWECVWAQFCPDRPAAPQRYCTCGAGLHHLWGQWLRGLRPPSPLDGFDLLTLILNRFFNSIPLTHQNRPRTPQIRTNLLKKKSARISLQWDSIELDISEWQFITDTFQRQLLCKVLHQKGFLKWILLKSVYKTSKVCGKRASRLKDIVL